MGSLCLTAGETGQVSMGYPSYILGVVCLALVQDSHPFFLRLVPRYRHYHHKQYHHPHKIGYVHHYPHHPHLQPYHSEDQGYYIDRSDAGDITIRDDDPTKSWVEENCDRLQSPEKEVCVLCGQEEEVDRRELCLSDPCMLATGEKRKQCNKLAEEYLKLFG